MLSFDFSGKVAVVSGAASGMGLLFSKKFVESGGKVVMSDVNADTLAAAVASVNEIKNDSAVGVACDVRDYTQVCAVKDLALEAFGRIDVLVPFAGGAEHRMLGIAEKDFPSVPIEAFDWSIDVNLKGAFYLAHAVAGVMRDQRSGVIVLIGSIAGYEGSYADVGYATSKSALMNGLTKSLAQYGAKYGMRALCVAPGPVLTRAAMANMKTAVGKAAEPEEIVNAILFYASDESPSLTGQYILIDGGRAIMLPG